MDDRHKMTEKVSASPAHVDTALAADGGEAVTSPHDVEVTVEGGSSCQVGNTWGGGGGGEAGGGGGG